jgi:hypothetical protein
MQRDFAGRESRMMFLRVKQMKSCFGTKIFASNAFLKYSET